MSANDSVRLKLRNNLALPRIVVLEPWADEITLSPGKTLEVRAKGDLSYPLELELFEDRIIVHAFDSEGAMLSVYQEGDDVPPNRA